MLEDRDYMRQSAYNDGPAFTRLFRWPKWSWTMALVVANVVVFLFECAISPHPLLFQPDYLSNYYGYVALSLGGLQHGYVWQLLTYQFMHAGFFHIFFNCWAIFMVGSLLEPMLGARNFLIVYFASGVAGGLLQTSIAYFFPQWFPDVPVVGASAAAFGLVAAFAALDPEQEFTLILLVFPINMRAKTLVLVSAALALGGLFLPSLFDRMLGGNVANAAHLGGLLFGLVYVRKVILGRWFHTWFQKPVRATPPPPRRPDVLPAKPAAFWHPKPARPEVELSADELLRTQVDPILDKISAHGLHSLTAREREILEKASGKLAKR
jgi:membrane associated rhomboid family serine protease